MEIATISPSVEARALFGRMVARADDNLILQLDETMGLYVDRKNAGKQPQAGAEINELVASGWIGAHEAGGWVLYEGVGL